MEEILVKQSNNAENIQRPEKLWTPQLKTTATTLAIQLGMIFGFLLVWQFVVEREWVSAFLVGSPAGIFSKLWEAVNNGSLWENTKVTVVEAIAGFLIGSLLGSFLGLSLWYSSFFARVVEPFIVAINSVPKIAFAPIVILWFGTGMVSKIMLATSMTFIIALISAYEAAKKCGPRFAISDAGFSSDKTSIVFQGCSSLFSSCNYCHFQNKYRIWFGRSSSWGIHFFLKRSRSHGLHRIFVLRPGYCLGRSLYPDACRFHVVLRS